MGRSRTALSRGLLVIAALNAAPAGTDGQSFQSGVAMVPVSVAVERADGTYAAGLDQTQFHIADEGRPQSIALFDDGSAPIDLVLLLDTSASMNARLPTMKSAASRIVRALRPSDRATILAFGVRTTVAQPFTPDVGVLGRAIGSLQCEGSTSLYDALYVALREFGSPQEHSLRRRAVVVFSDGDDTASLTTFDDVLDSARRRSVTTYTVRMVSPTEETDRFARAAVELRDLARNTGGRAFTSRGIEELTLAYESIAAEIAHQYVLGFIPESGHRDGFHRLTVVVDAPHARIRARAGYIATGP